MKFFCKYIALGRPWNCKLRRKTGNRRRDRARRVNASSGEMKMFRLSGCLVVSVLALGLSAPAQVGEKQAERVVNRPRVPGKLRLHLRERREEPRGKVKVSERTVDWEA